MENKNITEMKKVLSQERKHKVEFLKLLLEAEKTRWHCEAGYSGLLSLCTSGLGLSRSSALKRIVETRLASRFPVILDRLEAGRVHLTALLLISRYLREDNQEELLKAAELPERELEKWLAAKFPKATPESKEKLKWLNEEEAELTLLIDNELIALIERAKELMKHEHPKGDTVPLLKSILKKHLKAIDPLRRTVRPTPAPKTTVVHPRRIPRGIQTEVWKRDNARCTYVSPEGKRCEETGGLEIDHRQPWAHGGSSKDPQNLRLLCFAHNRYLALKTFGKRYVSRPLPGP